MRCCPRHTSMLAFHNGMLMPIEETPFGMRN